MKRARRSPGPLGLLLVVAWCLAEGIVLAENVDPLGDGSQYAWAENVGWLNAEPQGNGGPGMQVNDFELTGTYAWPLRFVNLS